MFIEMLIRISHLLVDIARHMTNKIWSLLILLPILAACGAATQPTCGVPMDGAVVASFTYEDGDRIETQAAALVGAARQGDFTFMRLELTEPEEGVLAIRTNEPIEDGAVYNHDSTATYDLNYTPPLDVEGLWLGGATSMVRYTLVIDSADDETINGELMLVHTLGEFVEGETRPIAVYTLPLNNVPIGACA